MLLLKDIKRILTDMFRTELARKKVDSLALLDEKGEEDFFERLPQQILKAVSDKAALFFGYEPRVFSSLNLMTDYSYAAFLHGRKLTFLTSGSTGTPKPCIHTLNMIEEEANGLASDFKGVKRVVSLVPANHMYGFSFTVTLPYALNVPVLALPALPTQPWSGILQEGDLIVGFPLFWNYWVRLETPFPKGVHAMSSTAPCKKEIIDALYKLRVSQFTEIYGASETGAIARRHQSTEAFELFPFWDLSFTDEQPQIKRKSQNAWLTLPDEVEATQGRLLIPLKRSDACVQVAGVNVFPKRVETVLSAHPAVKACRVRLMRPEEGERLKAFIVLNDGYSPEHLGIIRTYLGQRLTVHELPRSFTFGNELPVSSMEKDADW